MGSPVLHAVVRPCGVRSDSAASSNAKVPPTSALHECHKMKLKLGSAAHEPSLRGNTTRLRVRSACMRARAQRSAENVRTLCFEIRHRCIAAVQDWQWVGIG